MNALEINIRYHYSSTFKIVASIHHDLMTLLNDLKHIKINRNVYHHELVLNRFKVIEHQVMTKNYKKICEEVFL